MNYSNNKALTAFFVALSMKIKSDHKYGATAIGAAFTRICLLLTITIFVLILSVLPGAGIQYLIKLVL